MNVIALVQSRYEPSVEDEGRFLLSRSCVRSAAPLADEDKEEDVEQKGREGEAVVVSKDDQAPI